MFMVLHAALAALLTAHGAGTDLPIGTMVAGRTDDQLTDLVGCFASTLILRTDTSDDPPFAALLSQVRETTLTALDHQHIPYATPRPQVMVIHHEQPDRADLEGDGTLGTFESLPTGRTQADLTLSFYEPRGTGPVHCELIYGHGCGGPAAAGRYAHELQALLQAAATAPTRRLSELLGSLKQELTKEKA